MKKSIATSNQYLRNPTKRAALVRRSMTSSTAIEGVHIERYKATLRKLKQKKN